jgi:hypothetical protein
MRKLVNTMSVARAALFWSAVEVVCPAWSSGVDKVCSSQYFDSLTVCLLIPRLDVLRC